MRYTDNSFNVNDGRFTKAVQGSHYMFIPKLDAANKEYRKQNKESKNQDQLKMLFCNEKQNDCANYSKNNPIGTKFESHYPTLLRLPTDRSYDDIKRGVKPNVEEELSNAADRYSKDTSSDMSSKSNIDCNYYFEDETSSEVVHKFAGRLKTDNVTKKSTAKNIKSIHGKEDKTDQKNKDLTPTKRSLKRRHVLSENFMNGKLIKKNDLTGDNPKTEVKTFKRYRLKNNNIHNKNSDSNISKVFQLTKTNNIKSFDETIQSLDKSFHINKSVKKLEKVSIYDLNEYENYDNTVKNTTWEFGKHFLETKIHLLEVFPLSYTIRKVFLSIVRSFVPLRSSPSLKELLLPVSHARKKSNLKRKSIKTDSTTEGRIIRTVSCLKPIKP